MKTLSTSDKTTVAPTGVSKKKSLYWEIYTKSLDTPSCHKVGMGGARASVLLSDRVYGRVRAYA